MQTLHRQTEVGQKTWACRCLHSVNCLLCLWYSPCKVKLKMCSSEDSLCHTVEDGNSRGQIKQLQKIKNPVSSPIFLQKSVGLKDVELLMEHISTLLHTFWTQNSFTSIYCEDSQFSTVSFMHECSI